MLKIPPEFKNLYIDEVTGAVKITGTNVSISDLIDDILLGLDIMDLSDETGLKFIEIDRALRDLSAFLHRPNKDKNGKALL